MLPGLVLVSAPGEAVFWPFPVEQATKVTTKTTSQEQCYEFFHFCLRYGLYLRVQLIPHCLE